MASVIETVLRISRRPGNVRNSEGSFVKLNDGRILFAYSRFGNDACDDSSCVIASRESSDGGRTWTQDDRIIARHPLEGGNVMSVSFLRLDATRIAIFYLRKVVDGDGLSCCHPIMRISSDEGATWGAERTIADDGQYVINNDRAVRLSSGRIVLPTAHHRKARYCSGWGFDPCASLACFYSDDDGESWKLGNELDVANADVDHFITQEPGVIERRDGRVTMWCRTNAGRQWQAVSDDGCLSFHDPAPSPMVSPCSPASVVRLKDGRLFAVWNDHEGREELNRIGPSWSSGVRTPLTCAVSEDEGRTWIDRVDLKSGHDESDALRNWYCYTALLEEDGHMLVAFMESLTEGTLTILRVPLNGVHDDAM